MRRSVFAAAVAMALGVLAATPTAHRGGARDRVTFRPLATFNVPGATTAEIVSVSRDGRYLVYSDAIGQKFGKVDITNPAAPVQVVTLDAGGDPTSIAVLPVGRYAVACVQPGRLVLIDLDTFTIAGERAIGTGPDAVAVTQVGGQLVAVIAIENEGAEKGYVEVVRLNLDDFAASPTAAIRFDDPAALTSAGLVAIDDPQPELVSVHGRFVAATLQENNGIAVIDIANPSRPRLERLFSAGRASERKADLAADSRIAFTDSYPSDVIASGPGAGLRIPDAIAWSADGSTLFTADEGEEDYEGGRGWSARGRWGVGDVDDRGSLEAIAVRYGHYPEGRSDAKGIEAEGLTTAVFGRSELMFVSSERGAFVAVYQLDACNTPTFVQLLSTGQGPEGVLPIPGRDLLVTANEGDDGDGSLSIFQAVRGEWAPSPSQPTLLSRSVREPWGALSGLAPGASPRDGLYGVPDSALPSALFHIDTGSPYAGVRQVAPITRDGVRMLYDLEGITPDTSIVRPARHAGFWLVSEGDASTTKNLLIQIDAFGKVRREVPLPADVDVPGGLVTSNGFEGVAVSSNGRYLLVAVQRPFSGDQAVSGRAHTRIARYDLRDDRWHAFFYPLEIAPGTIGLSEIALLGRQNGADLFAVIERDNRLAGNATVKRIYTFNLADVTPVDVALPANAASIAGATVRKRLLADLLTTFSPYEKVEGLAMMADRSLWVVLDNDGGEFESRLVRLRARTIK